MNLTEHRFNTMPKRTTIRFIDLCIFRFAYIEDEKRSGLLQKLLAPLAQGRADYSLLSVFHYLQGDFISWFVLHNKL